MLCEICQKREAVIFIQEIIDGEEESLCICGECILKFPGKFKLDSNFEETDELNIADILQDFGEQLKTGVMGEFAEKSEATHSKKYNLTCPICGYSQKLLEKHGKVGCPECYKAFQSALRPLIQNMHQGKTHKGKKVEKADGDCHYQNMLNVMRFEKQLLELVKQEKYEEAAKLRDEIFRLKEQIATEGGHSNDGK